jgi:hypothetical protein
MLHECCGCKGRISWRSYDIPSEMRRGDRHSKRIRGKVISASPKIVVLKTSWGTRRLSRAV